MGVSSALERQREVKVEKSSYSASSVGHFCYVFSLNRSAVTVECIPGCTLPDSFTIALSKMSCRRVNISTGLPRQVRGLDPQKMDIFFLTE